MAAVVDELRVREHADGVDESGDYAVALHGITDTWIAPGAPWPPTDLIA